MIRQFVAEFGIIYGEYRLTSNVHSLLHIYDDDFGTNTSITIFRTKNNGVVVHVNRDTRLSPGIQANWFVTKDLYIVQYCGAKVQGSSINFYGKAFNKITESLTYHYSPMMKNIYEADVCDLSIQEM
uniref:Uncharacterized protein n=1 Tax=Anopheles funestus TaxID=62324 RepID=A0A182S0G1_ANOFN